MLTNGSYRSTLISAAVRGALFNFCSGVSPATYTFLCSRTEILAVAPMIMMHFGHYW